MTTTDSRIQRTISLILNWLVAGDYVAIERFTQGVRLPTSELQQAIVDYGRTLIMPPASALDNLDIIEIENSSPRAWSVVADLWTEEEGRSDLSLVCTLIDQPGDLLAVEVDDLRVL
ncbi:hypothetical protein GCM10027343_32710 [Noviherbaspirillum agri]